MNNTAPLNIKTDISDLRTEVRILRSMLEKVFVLLGGDKSFKDDVSDEEMMDHASRVFNVTSKKTKDDINIADPKKIKPVDFSSYV